jgi:hypothetical protein
LQDNEKGVSTPVLTARALARRALLYRATKVDKQLAEEPISGDSERIRKEHRFGAISNASSTSRLRGRHMRMSAASRPRFARPCACTARATSFRALCPLLLSGAPERIERSGSTSVGRPAAAQGRTPRERTATSNAPRARRRLAR